MNKEFVLFHLKEAQEAISSLIKEIETDPDFVFLEHYSSMQHLYHHINSSWNAREIDEQRTDKCTAEDFKKWSQYPSDIDMFE